MSYMCQICFKESQMGRSQQHARGVAGKRWRKRSQETARLFKPNLQKVSLKLNDSVEQWKICTKCLKRIKKYKAIGDFKNISVATA